MTAGWAIAEYVPRISSGTCGCLAVSPLTWAS